VKASPTALPHVQGKRRPFIHGLILLLVVGSAVYTALSPGDLFSSSHSGANPMAGLSLPGVAAAVPKGFNPVQTPPVLAENVWLSAVVSRLENMAGIAQPDEPVTRVYAAAVTPEPGATPAAATLEPGVTLPAEIPEPGATPGATTLEPGVTLPAEIPEPEATPPAASAEPPPIFTVYEVQPGDTVSTIATRFGLQPESIVWNNVEVNDEDVLAVGQLLRIPATDGIIHQVRLDETLSDIATRYGVDLSAITTFTSNGIQQPDDIQEKQLVFVPGGTVAPTPEPEPAAAAESAEPAGEGTAAEPATEPSVPFTPSAGLIWPVTGPISSYMGPSHPLGIDIDLYNSPNAPILAATPGVVTFAGGDACCSYGLYVVIVSPGGIETLYAHLSSINVVQGQQVAQGTVLGYGGCTGYCTGNHLHFEVIDNGVRVDPLSYLP
jgi:murein DD-endopeptidase MepM/ murein hydrolase activator NlpD